MNLPKVETIKNEYPQKVISEGQGVGEVICVCGEHFSWSLRESRNMVEWLGYIVPQCPSCKTTPSSDTRQMDL